MKKTIPLFIVIILLFHQNILGQDCRSIVLPMYNYNEEVYNNVPDDKLAIHCAYARNMFYIADEWPEGNPIYIISEVKNISTGEFLSKEIEINLDSLSYYAYNFIDFQSRHNDKEIYFETIGSRHRYLVLRTPKEAFLRTIYPERYE